MSEIKIKCPTCGKILRVPDSPTVNNNTFTCPVCKEKHKVGNCPRYVEKPKPATNGEETQYSSQMSSVGGEETQYVRSEGTSSAEETQIVGASQQIKVGCLKDYYGNTYQLRIGINTIGRKANTSTATVQINITDKTMSRNHAIIDVRNTGGQIIHILRNGANKNPSYLNGTLIGANDQLILNNGDRVKFGSTELMFQK